ncbi:MAG: energy transducer TonB [Desulfarculaceae bacterium]|nr:energy transducer TonB [Desulfarculaceae bacterium]MCF8072647.1 energy transducer TonB [Desulfarculaceae bacterium]MCF8102526.1 energy transducer TonB [Desulfarculaceae bacterium]MCF8117971.1 energy transducer TonB [Desulfarculaceae bacterium]
MNTAALSQRPPRPVWLLALAGAVFINLVIFGAASWLLSGQPPRPTLEAVPLSAFLPLPKPPPPEVEQEPPPPPPPPKITKLKPMKAAPLATPQPQLETPRLDLELNPRLALGPAIAAPGPARYGLGEVDRAPLARGQAPPPYPYLARRRGISGAVTVRFLVDRQGVVRNLEVLNAKPAGIFEETVLKTVSRWRFAPGVKDGEAVETWVETTIRFKLERR